MQTEISEHIRRKSPSALRLSLTDYTESTEAALPTSFQMTPCPSLYFMSPFLCTVPSLPLKPAKNSLLRDDEDTDDCDG